MSEAAPRALILVVEDDAANSEVIASTLVEFGGYRVVTEQDPEQALARLEALTPDLMLLDVLMPRRSGFDILRDLHARPHIPRPPVIAVSADVRPAVREEAGSLGCVEFLPKPFGIDELLEVVARVLGQPSTPQK